MMDLDTYFQTYSHQAIFNIGIDFNYLDQMVVERPPINFGITLRDVNMTFKYHPLIYLETEISTYEITLTEGYFGFKDSWDEALALVKLFGKLNDHETIQIEIYNSKTGQY